MFVLWEKQNKTKKHDMSWLKQEIKEFSYHLFLDTSYDFFVCLVLEINVKSLLYYLCVLGKSM